MKILIKNGRVIDPANKIDEVRDILIENSKISAALTNIKEKTDKIIDASGKIVMPGIVDMHAHLRQPGREDKETIASGTKAALHGGVTSLLAMPNTHPAIDSLETIGLLKKIIKDSASADVFIAAAITKGRQGKELTEIAQLKQEGAIAISDDGASVDSEQLMLEALKIAKEQGIAVIAHCEDRQLSNKGVVNLGITSTRLGLRGISKESEFLRVKRDIHLAEKAKAAIHITHISCKESVQLIRDAKKKGIAVTADTTPHYFSLTEEAVLGFDTNMKMNPPLRSEEDKLSIRQGLADGTIDAIASDHAPHTENEKEIEFEHAEFGVIGLETELSAAITELIETGILNWPELAQKFCGNPAKILGISKGALGAGLDADIAIVDPAREWIVAKSHFFSQSKNSAFLNRKLKGVVEFTLVSGKIMYQQ